MIILKLLGTLWVLAAVLGFGYFVSLRESLWTLSGWVFVSSFLLAIPAIWIYL